MGQSEVPGSVERLQFAETRLWAVAVAFFGIGDLVTTTVGLSIAGVYEAGVVSGFLVEQYGLVSMVAVKLALLALFYLLWRLTPRPHRVGVPLGLALLGVIVVWWNLSVKTVAILF
jgi:hypothetical protein